MKISVEPFAKLPDGRQANLYKLENDSGMRAEITNFGGCLIRLFVPDKNGKSEDVVLGHPTYDGYLKNPEYYGALVGRNSNRIAGARVNLGGNPYTLCQNDGNNNLHSGPGGLSFRLMAAEARVMANQLVLLLSTTIEDMGDGFPGNLTVSVAYALTDTNALTIDYRAVSDQDTVINLTNHSYFNLAGQGNGTVNGHLMQMDAPFYTPGNDQCYPTGEIRSVKGTPFDFQTARPLGDGIASHCEQIKLYGGYDHNLLFDGSGYRKTATVTEPNSGRVMHLYTNLFAVQLYTSNQTKENSPGKDGTTYGPFAGFCLETQFVPNAVHMPWLMSPVFRAGEEYATSTGFHFSTI